MSKRATAERVIIDQSREQEDDEIFLAAYNAFDKAKRFADRHPELDRDKALAAAIHVEIKERVGSPPKRSRDLAIRDSKGLPASKHRRRA